MLTHEAARQKIDRGWFTFPYYQFRHAPIGMPATLKPSSFLHLIREMNNLSECSVCDINQEVTLPLTTHRSIFLGYGLEISIDDLETAASSGCQFCSLLSSFLRVFRKLTPDFETNYLWREPTDLFLQTSDVGTLLIALRCEASYVDHFELYTQGGESSFRRKAGSCLEPTDRRAPIPCRWIRGGCSRELNRDISNEENQALDVCLQTTFLLHTGT